MFTPRETSSFVSMTSYVKSDDVASFVVVVVVVSLRWLGVVDVAGAILWGVLNGNDGEMVVEVTCVR